MIALISCKRGSSTSHFPLRCDARRNEDEEEEEEEAAATSKATRPSSRMIRDMAGERGVGRRGCVEEEEEEEMEEEMEEEGNCWREDCLWEWSRGIVPAVVVLEGCRGDWELGEGGRRIPSDE